MTLLSSSLILFWYRLIKHNQFLRCFQSPALKRIAMLQGLGLLVVIYIPLQNVYLWTNKCVGHCSHKTSNVNILASFPTWFSVFFLNKNNIVTRIRLLTRLSPHSQQKKRNLSLFWTCSDGYIIATTSDISDYCLILLFVYGVWEGKQKKMCT